MSFDSLTLPIILFIYLLFHYLTLLSIFFYLTSSFISFISLTILLVISQYCFNLSVWLSLYNFLILNLFYLSIMCIYVCLSTSISSKNNVYLCVLMNWFQNYFIFYYCLINFKILCTDPRKSIIIYKLNLKVYQRTWHMTEI